MRGQWQHGGGFSVDFSVRIGATATSAYPCERPLAGGFRDDLGRLKLADDFPLSTTRDRCLNNRNLTSLLRPLTEDGKRCDAVPRLAPNRSPEPQASCRD